MAILRTTARYLFVLNLALCSTLIQPGQAKQAPLQTVRYGLPDEPKSQDPSMGHTCVPANSAATDMPVAELVQFPGADGVTLHGFLYRPLSADAHSQTRLPALIWNHGSEKLPGQQTFLARFYVDHGFVFFIPHRRGQGRSADAGPYVGDLTAEPANASQKYRAQVHEIINNEDVIPAINWLKQQPFVDPQRIIMSGVSYGGIQTILTAEKDPGVRAYIPFAPGAMSWRNPELQQLLIEAVKKARAPIFLIQARGDYSLGPSTTLPPYFLGHNKLSKARLYDQFGCSEADAHAKFATWEKGIAIWGPDVLKFINDVLR